VVAHPHDLVARVRLPRVIYEFFELWRRNLLVLTSHMHRCHTDKLKLCAINLLPHEVSVDQIHCNEKSLFHEPQSLHVSEKPFDENGPHLGIDV
jgi:hypothetical protein